MGGPFCRKIGGWVKRQVRTSQTTFVPLPVRLNVLLVTQPQLLQRLDDRRVATGRTHLLGGEIGVAAAVLNKEGGWVDI